MNDCVDQKCAREEKEKARHMQQRGRDGKPEGQKACLRLKERLHGEK